MKAIYCIIMTMIISLCGALCTGLYADVNVLITDTEVASRRVEFIDKTLDIAFPYEITRDFPTYVRIMVRPSPHSTESQIIIGLKPGKRAQINYRKAGIALRDALKYGSNNEEEVAELMRVEQKQFAVSADVAMRWIEGFWTSIEEAIRQIEKRNPYEVMLDADRYLIEVYRNQN